MNLKSAIVISTVLHVIFMAIAYTTEVPEEVEAESETFREIAAVEFKTIRRIEISKDGSDDPAQGVPEPRAEEEPEEPEEPEAPAEQKPEPEPEPEPKPDVEPEPEPELEQEVEEAEPAPAEELKSVVTDKSDAADSPAETAEEAEDTARAEASTAPVDGGRGDGHLDDQRDGQPNANKNPRATSRTGGPAGNNRGIRQGSGADQKKLNQKYGLVLHRQINHVKRYPTFARKASIEGRVLVAITVDARGNIIDVSLKNSSGHRVLDEQTVATIRRIERFPAPPDGLSWQTKTFVLPVSYKLS